ELVNESCDRLVDAHTEIYKTFLQPKKSDSQPSEPKGSDVQQPREPIDKFVVAEENRAIVAERPATFLPTTLSRNQQQSVRQFSEEDCQYILEPISSRPEYFTLIYALSQPLSKAGFTIILHKIRSKYPEDPELSAILAGIVERFAERWDNAKEVVSTVLVTPQKVSEIIIEEGKVWAT